MYAGRSKTPTPSIGGVSYYSTASVKSSGLRSTRSVKSVRIPWYRKPILQNAIFTDIQRGSLLVAIYTLLLSLFTLGTQIFDLYCLSEAAPGSTHYGYYIISFDFVYVGNMHVRNFLVFFALFSIFAAMGLLVTSIMLINALVKEYEKRIVPWLIAMAIFTGWRFLSFLFGSIVGDLIFGYNITMTILWSIFTILNVFGLLLVYSLYLELSDLTKLEDLAHLRMGTMTSLNASYSGSRPTTPYSANTSQQGTPIV